MKVVLMLRAQAYDQTCLVYACANVNVRACANVCVYVCACVHACACANIYVCVFEPASVGLCCLHACVSLSPYW